MISVISVLHHRPSKNRWAEWLHSKFIKVRTTETSLHPRFYHRPSLMRQWKYPEIETPLLVWTVSFVWESLGVNGNHLKLALANQLMNSGNLGWQHSRNAHPQVVSIFKQPISQDWRCVTDLDSRKLQSHPNSKSKNIEIRRPTSSMDFPCCKAQAMTVSW